MKYYPEHRAPIRGKQQPTHQSKNGWVVFAFILGYLFSAVCDFNTTKQLINTHLVARFAKKAPLQVAASASLPTKPKLEFYTLLTKEDPVASEQPDEGHPSTVKPQEMANAAPTIRSPANESSGRELIRANENYTVQLAAFNTVQDAEHMKASLLLKGFKVNIITAMQNRTQWYRVVLGPFSTRNDAEMAMQSIAKRERINGMIRKASA